MVTQRQRQPLLIDPYYTSSHASSSPPSPSSSILSDMSSASRSPSSAGDDWQPRFVCFVLCLYDYKTTDQDHLPFKKNEILEIVKQEESGWWAALRGDKIGWVPSAFLLPLTDDMAETLRNMREELRIFEYDAERLYNSAPISNLTQFYDSTASPDSPVVQGDDWVPIVEPGGKTPYMQTNTAGTARDFPDDVVPTFSSSSPLSPPHQHPGEGYSTASELEPAPAYTPGQSWQSRPYPPSPSTPMPQPQPQVVYPKPHVPPLLINKPTPPTPMYPSPSAVSPARSLLYRSRSDSAPSILANSRTSRRRPIILDDHSSLSRLSVYIDSNNPAEVNSLTTPDLYKSFDFPEGMRSPVVKGRADKVRQLTGDDDAQAFHNAKVAEAAMPWYLRPAYSADEIKLEYDGSVRAGTLGALVERLTVDPLKLSQETIFRQTFLMTFRTFATADEVFDLLVERYEMDHPASLTAEEFEEWKEKKLRPVQNRVLNVFSAWMEKHGMLRDDPQIAPRLKEFLCLIVTPAPQVFTAKQMLQRLDRMTLQMLSPPPIALASSKRRKPKMHRNDLLRMDAADLAQQLTLYEYRLYVKIRPQECLTWAKTQKGDSVANLITFCSTHDKIASWVKMSVLSNDGLGKRADTIDLWIKVAEKCRSLNNLSSMSAIAAALSSPVISRLHLTWAHVSRGSHLEPLTKLNEPTANFTAFRTLHNTIEGPCVPFIGMYLSDIVHVQDQLKDTIVLPATSPSSATTSNSVLSHSSSRSVGSAPSVGVSMVNFVKRQKWYDAVHAIVRSQAKLYSLGENPSTMSFVEGQLQLAAGRDQASFWTRSQDLQQNEVAHADIRKGLEAAGF